MDALETFEHAGCVIGIYYDDDPSSPADWDTLGTMYPLSRDAAYRGFAEVADTHGQAIEAMERRGVRGLLRYLSLCYGIVAVPFDVFEHGTVALREASPDDDSCSGYIATTDARLDELCGNEPEYHAPEWVRNALSGELGTWSDYFDGSVVGYVVSGQSGETVDSCWGFYPDESSGDGYDYVRQEAREAAEYEQRERARAERDGIATEVRT